MDLARRVRNLEVGNQQPDQVSGGGGNEYTWLVGGAQDADALYHEYPFTLPTPAIVMYGIHGVWDEATVTVGETAAWDVDIIQPSTGSYRTWDWTHVNFPGEQDPAIGSESSGSAQPWPTPHMLYLPDGNFVMRSLVGRGIAGDNPLMTGQTITGAIFPTPGPGPGIGTT